MADWTPPASDAVAVAPFVPPESDRVVAAPASASKESLPVVNGLDDLAKIKVGSDYIDANGARQTFTPEAAKEFADRYFNGPSAGMLAGLPKGKAPPGSAAAKSILLQGGFGTAGAIAGSIIPGAGTYIGGGLGAGLGNILDQETSPGYDANKPGLGIKKGQVLAATAAGAIPAAPIGSSIVKTLASNAIRQGAGGLAAKAIETGVDEGRLPTAQEAILASTIPAVAGAGTALAQSLNPATKAALAQANKAVAGKQAVLDKAMAEGFKVQPSSVNKTLAGNTLEGVGGTIDIKRDVQANNIEQFNRIAKRAAGLTPDQPINEVNLEAARNVIAQPYRDVAALSDNGGYTLYHDPSSTKGQKFFTSDPTQVTPPGQTKGATAQVKPENPLVVAEHPTQAEITQAFKEGHDAVVVGDVKAPDAVITPSDKSPAIILEGSARANAAKNLAEYQQAKSEAKDLYRSNVSNPDPSKVKAARALDDRADHLLTQIEQAAMDAQKPDLVPALQEAKLKLAQNYDIDRALAGRESIDPAAFGRDAKRNGVMGKSGDIKMLAQFALDHPDAAKLPINSSGVNKLSTILTGLGALYGGTTHGVEGGALAGAAGFLAPVAARNIVLSPAYQKIFARYPVASVPPTQDEVLALVKQLSQASGQKSGSN